MSAPSSRCPAGDVPRQGALRPASFFLECSMNTEAASPLTTASDNLFGPLISSYSRAQAIADGALIDVTETAFEAGFQWPVAISRRAWE
ncbi:DUF6573 family protein, partial [Acinetobacter baumannii]